MTDGNVVFDGKCARPIDERTTRGRTRGREPLKWLARVQVVGAGGGGGGDPGAYIGGGRAGRGLRRAAIGSE